MAQPDWAAVHRQLCRKGRTLSLIWEDYRAAHPDDGYGYSRFCDLYRRWEGQLPPTMRHHHMAGERVFVDYSGATVEVVDGETGEIRAAQIFVGLLGARTTPMSRRPEPRACRTGLEPMFACWPSSAVASHVRTSRNRKHTTVAAHMPASHRRYAGFTPAELRRMAEKIEPNTAGTPCNCGQAEAEEQSYTSSWDTIRESVAVDRRLELGL